MAVKFNNNAHLPVHGDGHKCEDTGCNRHVSHKVVHCAIHDTEWPVRVQHEDEVKYAVQ